MRDFNRPTREKIELSLDSRQVAAFVIGSLVMLGVVFALGVLVGKQLAASKLSSEAKPADPLAAIDAREQVRLTAKEAPAASEGAADAGVAPARPLTFADELTKPKPVNPIIEPTRPVAAPAPAKAEKSEKTAKKEPAAEERESASDRTGALSAAFDKASGKAEGGSYCLQVASLPTRGDADRVVKQLAGKGYSAYVVEAAIAGKGTFYRVRVGSYGDRDEAEQAQAKLKKKAGMSAIVTAK